MARASSAAGNLKKQASLFRNLQTVSMKGKKNLEGVESSSFSKSSFSLAGNRAGLGNYKPSSQNQSYQRGVNSSSLKRWEI